MKIEKIAAMMKMGAEMLPGFISRVIDEFYSPENAAKIGRGLAEYYKALKDGGIPEGVASQMVQDYASNLTLRGMGHMCRPMMRMGVGFGMPLARWGMHQWMKHGKGDGEEQSEES